VGDYRILCQIKDGQLLVLVISVGHRKNVYD
jgi:mRNA interferase RelE/StbE